MLKRTGNEMQGLKKHLKDTRVQIAIGLSVVILVFLLLWTAVVAWVRLDPVDPVSKETQAWIVEYLRAAIEKHPIPRRPSDGKTKKELQRKFPGPVFVVLYSNGRVIFRHVSKPKTRLSDAIFSAAEKLRYGTVLDKLSEEEKKQARIKVDITTAVGPMVTRPRILLSMSVVPGVDGLGLRQGERSVYMAPDELLRRNLVTGFKPFKFIDEFKAGLDVDKAVKILSVRIGAEIPSKRKLPAGELFRFKTQGFVEPPWSPADSSKKEGTASSDRGEPLPVFRGNTPAPPFNRRNLIKTLVNGGNYMLRMLARKKEVVVSKGIIETDGRRRFQTELELLPGEREITRKGRLLRGQFRYIYFPLTDNFQIGGYSLPRHAGTTYGLALLAGMLKDNPHVSSQQVKRFRDGAVLAIEYLAERVKKNDCKGPNYRCVSLGRITDLGSTALAVVAVMEYTRQTRDRRFLELGRKMANFLVYMQEKHKDKPEGEFCHIYHVDKKKRECKTRLLYYSGEAALALAMSYKLLKDPKYLKAAKIAMDYQTGPYLAPFTMKFLYGEDHWTAMAAEEIWPHGKKDAYADFAYGYSKFQQRHQFTPGETPFDDYVGGYGITPFFPPHLTPAGSRTEAAVSAYRLSQKRGEPNQAIKNQCIRAFKYIHMHQVRADNSYMFVDPEMSHGAIRKSPVKFDVRIDYVQHTMAAIVRGLDMVPK